MIYDPIYWLNFLGKQYEIIHKKRRQKQWQDNSYYVLEQSIMLTFYTLRKLHESDAVKFAFFDEEFDLTKYNARSTQNPRSYRLDIEKYYQIENPKKIKKKFSYIANQIIHSFVFVPIFKNRNQVYGFAFNSDRSKSNELYMLDLEILEKLLSGISGRYIGETCCYKICYDENGKPYLGFEANQEQKE